MRRAGGNAVPMVTVNKAPTAPIPATAHRAPTSAASVPTNMLPSVRATALMEKITFHRI